MLLDVGVPRADVCGKGLEATKRADVAQRTVKRTLVGHVVHEEDAHRAAVIRRRNCPEALLARCIPLPSPFSFAVGSPGAERHTIWSLMRLPSSSIVRILKSMPIVVINDGVHWSSQNRRSRHDLPTPESPISSSCVFPGQTVSDPPRRENAP